MNTKITTDEGVMETMKYFLITVDPVHIGTGGYRLGRVDNSIVREPGTHIPKIPGTALHGAIRQYAAKRFGKPQCAGQSGHCGRPTCPICYTFGSITGGRAQAGVVSIFDARILFFPVYSMVGPVWVTCPTALRDADFKGEYEIATDTAKIIENSALSIDKTINLGWLMVEREGDFSVENIPQEVPVEIRNKLILVSDQLFSHIVNSNLEVRTSVSINPETGAAEEGALFTYEAIPRATVLWMDAVVDDYRGAFPSQEKLDEWKQNLESENIKEKQNLLQKWGLIEKKRSSNNDEALSNAQGWIQDSQARWENIRNVEQSVLGIINSGLEWIEHLGIGGMGTRGFGRVKVLCYTSQEVENEIDQCQESKE